MGRRKKNSCSDIIYLVVGLIVCGVVISQCTDKSSPVDKTPTVRPSVTPTRIVTPSPTWTLWYRSPTPRPTKTQSSECHSPSCGCVIKGNINSDGEKIYHCPNSPNYDETRINKTGERYFCTEEDAIAAGFRKSDNMPYCGGF